MHPSRPVVEAATSHAKPRVGSGCSWGQRRRAGVGWAGRSASAPGGQEPTECPAEVRLPRDTRIAREDAPEHAAVQQEDHEPEDDLTSAAGVEAADHQVGQPAEHDTAGAEGDRSHGREQPDGCAADEYDDERGAEPLPPAVEQHQDAEQEERDGVRHQVRPAAVQPRRDEHADQALARARTDAVGVEGVAACLVDALQQPHARDEQRHRDARGDEPRTAAPGAGVLGGHATSVTGRPKSQAGAFRGWCGDGRGGYWLGHGGHQGSAGLVSRCRSGAGRSRHVS